MGRRPLEEDHARAGVQTPASIAARASPASPRIPHPASDAPWWQCLTAMTTDPVRRMDSGFHAAAATPGFLCNLGTPGSPGAEGRSPKSALGPSPSQGGNTHQGTHSFKIPSQEAVLTSLSCRCCTLISKRSYPFAFQHLSTENSFSLFFPLQSLALSSVPEK